MRAGIVLLTLFCAVPAFAERVGDPVLGGADTIEGDEAPGLVAFTFDDGPRVGTTDRVIEALVAYDVPAAFFVVGKRLSGKSAQPARDLVARMVELGFDIGNHTFSHENLEAIDPKKAAHQVDRTSELLGELLGRPVGLFRAPFGAVGKAAAAHVEKRGLTTVEWSIDSLDWRQPKAEAMRKAIVEGILRENGGVVLMHDTKKVTAKTLAAILDDLEAANCKRLAAGEPIILPVSIHYFLRDDKAARAVPPEVEQRTRRYRENLPARCAKRNVTDM